jgi:hypothetical protein
MMAIALVNNNSGGNKNIASVRSHRWLQLAPVSDQVYRSLQARARIAIDTIRCITVSP